MTAPAPSEGWVAAPLREELPRLGIVSLAVDVERRLGRSPRGVRERLALLADRFRGGDALVLRQRPVPHAYRVFFRQIGLDPDVTRTPVEAAAVDRLVRGGFVSRGLLADALTVATVETGVPLWALDGARVDGPLGLRITGDDEALGEVALGEGAVGEGAPREGALPLPPGRIVVADARRPLALLFGAAAAGVAVSRQTRRVLLYAIVVDGVSAMHVAEALSICSETLRS